MAVIPRAPYVTSSTFFFFTGSDITVSMSVATTHLPVFPFTVTWTRSGVYDGDPAQHKADGTLEICNWFSCVLLKISWILDWDCGAVRE